MTDRADQNRSPSEIHSADMRKRMNPGQRWWSHQLSIYEKDATLSSEEKSNKFWNVSESANKLNVRPEASVKESIELDRLGEPPDRLSNAHEILTQYHQVLQKNPEDKRIISASTEVGEVIKEIPRVGDIVESRLKESGYETVGDLYAATNEELLSVNRVGKGTADKLKQYIDTHYTPEEAEQESVVDDSRPLKNKTRIDEIYNEIPDVGVTSCRKLQNAGYNTVGELRVASRDDLTQIDQIGVGTARKIQQYISQEVKTQSPAASERIPDETPIEEFTDQIPKIDRVICSKLKSAGFETVGDLRAATSEEIAEADYVGQKRAETILQHIR